MFCGKCGGFLPADIDFCPNCGVAVPRTAKPVQQPLPVSNKYHHNTPKCLNCGYVGEWNLEPVMRTCDWVIGGVLILCFGFGFLYWIIIGAIRSKESHRAKICPSCNAVNQWSYEYEDEFSSNY